MKTVEVGGKVYVKRLGVTGTVERIDSDGFYWLKTSRFPGRLGLPVSELKMAQNNMDRT